jgi:hypothetical protein
VSEKINIIGQLEDGGFLPALAWAYNSAVTRTLNDYSEDAGYDAAWLGNTRFTLFRDRIDRVTSCGKYELRPGADSSEGLDLVHAQLTEREIETMPQFPPDLVRRADLNHSPGWRVGDVRFLLASCAFGKIDSLPWPKKSPTKQLVAKQPNPEPEKTLFDDFAADEIEGLLALGDDALDLATLVSAHSLDAVSQRRELVLGRPRLNNGGGEAWHWYVDLLAGPTPSGSRQPESPAPAAPDEVADAPVHLRRRAAEQSQDGGPR